MMRIHFIAIGGAAMHNLALALQAKNYVITGSDDEIFEPSRSRLEKAGLLPEKFGWFPEKINPDIDAVVLGMHALEDNLELLKAKELGLKIYSYPEFLYEQTKDKKRVVIGGSHGKTTITSMVMHVLRETGVLFDYMVGAQIEGFDTMVSLTDDAEIAVFEGDEYLSSPIDRRPKFHLYHPHIALISGIGWDHINVFPTFESYLQQFKIFIDTIEENGTLVYYKQDKHIKELVVSAKRSDISYVPYDQPLYEIREAKSFLKLEGSGDVPLEIFGDHNLQNLAGAKEVCLAIGISENNFYAAIQSFKGSAKRLQKLYSDANKLIFLDFAHSPSKVKGTIEAVKKQFSDAEIIAVYELHTFSSLNKQFFAEYKGTLDGVDVPIVFFNPEVVKHKKLPEIDPKEIINAFNNSKLSVVMRSNELLNGIAQKVSNGKQVIVYMSSGNFGGLTHSDLINAVMG
jgi:UDP-N-acetylmuramate: L-alanyl-gamma-D-glutamyl-meso-diaminopimelate ligase